MIQPGDLLLAFYGDDFTGSTDALEFLSRAGAKTVLFMEPPGEQQLNRYTGLQAIGIAGMSRAHGPDDMEKALRPAFTALRALQPRHVHYKVCSTFDSSPSIGSIGKAMDIGRELFPAPYIPVLGGAPLLGRYCVFGNLFARMGIGSNGSIYRLDRHPSMSRHPVTPADESDLALHLGKQTKQKIGLLDILQVAKPFEEAKKSLQVVVDGGANAVLIDALYEDQMPGIGRLIDDAANTTTPVFSIGSSGIGMALGGWWKESGKLTPPAAWPVPGRASSLLAVSGSCSPVTAAQITWAVKQGFREIAINTAALAENEFSQEAYELYIHDAISMLRKGEHVILHTGKGQAASMVAAATADKLGTVLGKIVRQIAAQSPPQRIVIAGGDTSSYAARALGIEAVEMIAPISPGAPLCRAYAPGSPVDGLEINLKGGQVGAEDYFGRVLEGK